MEKLTIVKVGGKVVESEEKLDQLLENFKKIEGKKILVHGGGTLASDVLKEMGIEPNMVDGRRITDAATLKVVTMVYGGLVNKNIVAQLQAKGVNALGLTGADLNVIKAVKRPVKDIDYGFVGDVKGVDSGMIKYLLEKEIVPILAPLTHDEKGTMLNTNADTIASEAAVACAAVFDVDLMYCFEKDGVLMDENDDSSVISNLKKPLYEQYVQDGIINKGMIPKLFNGFNAIDKGVSRVIITNAQKLDDKTGTVLS